jgi:hypothetical protein
MFSFLTNLTAVEFNPNEQSSFQSQVQLEHFGAQVWRQESV